MTRDYEDYNSEEQVIRGGQDGEVKVCGGGGGGGQLGGQQEV